MMEENELCVGKRRKSLGRIQKPRWKNGKSSIRDVNFNCKENDFKEGVNKNRIACELGSGNEWKALEEWQGGKPALRSLGGGGSREGPARPGPEFWKDFVDVWKD